MKNALIKIENGIVTLADSKGREFLVDETDLELISGYRWYIHQGYVKTGVTLNGKMTLLSLHRLIMSPLKTMDVDHIDGNKSNNSRTNLRICTPAENMWNQKLNSKNTSGVKGLAFSKRDNGWLGEITKNKKRIKKWFGTDKQAAIKWLTEQREELHGEFTRHN